MGVSTDAILFWGYCWTEEMAKPWDPEGEDASEEDAEGRYTRMRGEAAPSETYPKDADKSPEAERVRAAFSEHWARQRGMVKEAGVTVGRHCSDSCSMPYVAVAASEVEASRGNPEAVSTLAVGPDWRERLDAYCSFMGITPPEGQAPQWWLVSYWG